MRPTCYHARVPVAGLLTFNMYIVNVNVSFIVNLNIALPSLYVDLSFGRF